MEFILLVLALILAVFLGWLLKQSFNTSPWVAEPVGVDLRQSGDGDGHEDGRPGFGIPTSFYECERDVASFPRFGGLRGFDGCDHSNRGRP